MADPAREQLDQSEQRDQVPGHVPGPGPEVEERLAVAEAKAQEHLDDLKRLAAEFENYKKRTAREQASLSTRATEHLVKELLPIVDDLERALEAAEEHEEVKLEEGVRLVHRQLASALEREGLAVIEVLQKGYRLGDRVLRPARVVVAGSKEANGHGDS